MKGLLLAALVASANTSTHFTTNKPADLYAKHRRNRAQPVTRINVCMTDEQREWNAAVVEKNKLNHE